MDYGGYSRERIKAHQRRILPPDFGSYKQGAIVFEDEEEENGLGEEAVERKQVESVSQVESREGNSATGISVDESPIEHVMERVGVLQYDIALPDVI